MVHEGRLREDSSSPRSEHVGLSENRLPILLNDLSMLIIIAPLVATIGLLTVLNGIIIITPVDKVIYIYIYHNKPVITGYRANNCMTWLWRKPLRQSLVRRRCRKLFWPESMALEMLHKRSWRRVPRCEEVHGP